MKKFVNITYFIPEEQFEIAGAALSDTPFLGITEGLDELVICYNVDDLTDELRTTIEEEFRTFGVEFRKKSEEEIEEQNWNEEWEQSIQPVLISPKISIVPEWRKGETGRKIEVVITPKMSFGTGHHETTVMMCRFAEKLVLAGSKWIDAGTGTGVLAIAAVKIGAQHVFAFDYDDWSVANSQENIEMNYCSDNILLEKGDIYTIELPTCDGIFANIHRNLLIDNMVKFAQALSKDGHLVVSGILQYDVQEIRESASRFGFAHQETTIEGDWAAIHFTKS